MLKLFTRRPLLSVVISIIITLVGSIISDFMLALVDPRIRFS